MKSTRYTLSLRDLGKGLIMAIGTPILYYLQTLLPIDTSPEIKALVGGAITYLIKQFFTDDVKVAGKVINEAEQKAIDIKYKK